MVKLFYHDKFDLERESISLRKHKLVKDRLLNEGIISRDNIIEAKPLTMDDLLLVHTKEYIDAVKTGEPRNLAESNGIEWGEDVYERAIYSLGSVYQSLESALRNGISGSLSSGYHHAHRSHGKGFCTFNYVVSIKKLMLEGKIKNALIMDCDVHHPDGTEDCVGNDERIVSLSLNGTSAFKNEDNKVSHGIGLPNGIDYYKYESILEFLLSEAIERKKPDIILYKASQDSHELDIFGNLKFTADNLFERDQFVFRYARLKRIPITFTIGSGYTRPIDTTVNGHVNTIKAAIEVGEEADITHIDTDDFELTARRDEEMSKQIGEGKIYFIEKLIHRGDRKNNHKLCAGKVFNPHSQTYYYNMHDKWNKDQCMEGVGLGVLRRTLVNENEFREICKKNNIPNFIEEEIIKLNDNEHFHKELGDNLIWVCGSEFEN